VRLDSDPDVIDILQALSLTGARLSIDDFGAGTTSLAHLRNLPVCRLKLDRSLITDLSGADSLRATMIVRTLTELAGHLGLEVLAEGVEDSSQRDALVGEGVPLAQGYLFGRPGPLHEV
jgi:EAL domain-containing protein (putative c-di-GMP-specific phosphodiesterase class I)